MTKRKYGLYLLLWTALTVSTSADYARFFTGQDLHISADSGTWSQEPETHINWILLEGSVDITIGDNRINARSAVIRLENKTTEQAGIGRYYQAQLYLESDVAVKRGSRCRTTPMTIIEGADALAVKLDVSGQILVTTPNRQTQTPKLFMSNLAIGRAQDAFRQMRKPAAIPESAQVPAAEIRPTTSSARSIASSPAVADQPVSTSTVQPTQSVSTGTVQAQPGVPIHINAIWEPAPEIEILPVMADGRQVATVRGRFYLWQQHPERGLLEFQADNAVIYLAGDDFETANPGQAGNELGFGSAEAVYFQGNIVMTEDGRITRADQLFYDFVNQQALVVNAEFTTYDKERQIPVIVTAAKLKRINDRMFQGDEVRITSSEFYLPQLSLNASKMVLITPGQIENQELAMKEPKAGSDSKYRGIFTDVTAEYYDFPFFSWSRVETDFTRPEIPLSQLRIGNDSDFGTSVETRWNLARLLGRQEPEGVKSRLALDYFSERGYGAGLESEYEKQDAFGLLTTYIMSDRGKDDLGRIRSRRDLEPDSSTRGRFSFRHREYLPYDWQMTFEVSYISDRHFLEMMYRDEFNTDKSQETLIYLKRLERNTGISILGSVRINDFQTMIEELPTVEYFVTGESFWDDLFTFYSENRISRLRNRYDNENTPAGARGDFYIFGSTRNEVDLPLLLGTIKLVPFTAITYTYDDHDEFDRALDGSTVTPEEHLLLGEYGFRASTVFWKQDPSVRDSFWDLNGLRHVVTPHAEAVWYEQNTAGIEMRDIYNVGLSQLWQTQRGPAGRQRTVDWMRLDIDATWINCPEDLSIPSPGRYGPSGFLFNDPSIPDFLRRNDIYYSVVRNTLNADYEWYLTDTFAFRSDLNYDIQAGKIQQFDTGISRYVYPDLSYYLGIRCLRPLIINIPAEDIYERGSSALLAAITYRIDERYTAVFSQEYNFGFAKGIRSDFTLIRQYHRLFCGFSFSLDESLDRSGVQFTIWPQGVEDLTIGSRKYMGLSGAIQEY